MNAGAGTEQQLMRLISQGSGMTIPALAQTLRVSETQVRRWLAPLLERKQAHRVSKPMDSGQTAYVYTARGVERHKVYVTAPCPRCGYRRRLVKRPDGYYLIHCGVGALIEI